MKGKKELQEKMDKLRVEQEAKQQCKRKHNNSKKN